MSIYNITASLNGTAQSVGGRLYLPGASEFAKTLNLGEIIKGKVLRQYEGNRYQVNFNGHERVVDSAIPLRTGEILHGRVIAVGEQVELQRVYPEAANNESIPAETSQRSVLSHGRSQHEKIIDALFSRYQTTMSSQDRGAILKLMRTVSLPESAAMVSLAVNKLGLTQSPELLNALYRSYVASSSAGAKESATLVTSSNVAVPLDNFAANPVLIRDLSAVLRQVLDGDLRNQAMQGQSESGANDLQGATQHASQQPGYLSDDGNSPQDNHDAALARWVLNAQQQGMVAHRLGRMPMLINGRLAEIDIALFEQKQDKPNDESATRNNVRHRQIVFSLSTPSMGRVELLVKLAGNHVRVQVTSTKQDATRLLAEHADQLSEQLNTAGWQVDEVKYQTQGETAATNSVVAAVIEHIVSQDSLNRLI